MYINIEDIMVQNSSVKIAGLCDVKRNIEQNISIVSVKITTYAKAGKTKLNSFPR